MDLAGTAHLRRYFLPNIFQPVGLVLTIAGSLFTYLRFGAGIKPDFLNARVFAFYSTYFDTKYFKVIDNNLGEEICGITLLIGLFLIAFSKEKHEQDHYWEFRLRAFIITTYLSNLFLVISFIFVFGLAFFNMLSLYIVLPLLVYSLIFRYLIIQDRKQRLS